MYFHVGVSDYRTSRWCNSHKVSKHRACMFVQMHGVARSTVDFSKWWIGISVFCPFYSQGLRIRFGSLAVCANSRSDLRHLDFSVMISWNGSMMSCIWMARCMASVLGQKLLYQITVRWHQSGHIKLPSDGEHPHFGFSHSDGIKFRWYGVGMVWLWSSIRNLVFQQFLK